MRLTSSINNIVVRSSSTNRRLAMAEGSTREYATLKNLVPELRLAVQPHLVKLTGYLLAKHIITEEQDAELRNARNSEVNRAADLVSIVMNKVKLNPTKLEEFIDILKNCGISEIDDLINKTEIEPQVKPKSKRVSIAAEINEHQTDPSTSKVVQTSIHSTNQMQRTLELECNCQFCMRVCSSEAINFPMLNFDEKENEDNKYQLERETRSIMLKFHGVESGLLNTVCDKRIPIGQLKFHLNVIKIAPTFEESIFSDYEDKLQKATEADAIFQIVCKFWSFLDYDLLQHLIEIIGSDDDRKRMKEYRESFKDYATRRVRECPRIGAHKDGKWKDVYIKLDTRLASITAINDLKEFRFKVSEILGIDTSAIYFCCVKRGCIEVTWQIPSFISKIIFPFSSDKEEKLEQLGVIHFSCLGYTYTAPVRECMFFLLHNIMHA